MARIAVAISSLSRILGEITLTALLLVRLVKARRRFAKALPNRDTSSTYDGVIAIIVESAAPLTLFGIFSSAVAIRQYLSDGFSLKLHSEQLTVRSVSDLLYWSFAVSHNFST